MIFLNLKAMYILFFVEYISLFSFNSDNGGKQMGISEATRNRIKELCKAKKITINRLCYLSAVPQSTVSEFMRGKNAGTNIVILKKLCDGLDITIADFFDTDVFRSLEQEIK